jgi:hypothetical protein
LEWHNNNETIIGNLIDSTGTSSIGVDGGNTINNNLIINRNGSPGATASSSSYHTTYSGNTMVGLGAGANSTTIAEACIGWGQTDGGSPPITKNVIVGFQNAWADAGSPTSYCVPYVGGATTGNVTDLPNTSSNPTFTTAYGGWNVTGRQLATPADGNLFSQSPASLFVNPTSDFRLSPNSPARSVGAGVQ